LAMSRNCNTCRFGVAKLEVTEPANEFAYRTRAVRLL
jgi:hypothetical protein